jgi:hypothetical protein
MMEDELEAWDEMLLSRNDDGRNVEVQVDPNKLQEEDEQKLTHDKYRIDIRYGKDGFRMYKQVEFDMMNHTKYMKILDDMIEGIRKVEAMKYLSKEERLSRSRIVIAGFE